MQNCYKLKILKCPYCNADILSRYDDETVLRNKIIVFRGDHTEAKCKQCGRLVEVPIRLNFN